MRNTCLQIRQRLGVGSEGLQEFFLLLSRGGISSIGNIQEGLICVHTDSLLNRV
ncbi:hypothetical protein DPMN_109141 [Dreissena polymorpha]|uniref:Uncharacterized protein n=1 Tax=Dreissena polymorpha TaxID=45954 RepID=A0A9D4K9R4_DREPO|nr:hypothetical protein DPMN_109141 [Dreissena polymorpha]